MISKPVSHPCSRTHPHFHLPLVETDQEAFQHVALIVFSYGEVQSPADMGGYQNPSESLPPYRGRFVWRVSISREPLAIHTNSGRSMLFGWDTGLIGGKFSRLERPSERL